MNKYKLNILDEEWIEVYSRELILEWCKQNHPEVVEEIKNKVIQELNNELQNI